MTPSSESAGTQINGTSILSLSFAIQAYFRPGREHGASSVRVLSVEESRANEASDSRSSVMKLKVKGMARLTQKMVEIPNFQIHWMIIQSSRKKRKAYKT